MSESQREVFIPFYHQQLGFIMKSMKLKSLFLGVIAALSSAQLFAETNTSSLDKYTSAKFSVDYSGDIGFFYSNYQVN